jgi:uncharacterized membrane protein
MELALLSREGIEFLSRWLHVFFGIIWIGHLYYFNFVQGAFMAEAKAETKPDVLAKLLPKAMWWFRWGAMWTMVTGVAMLGLYGKQYFSVDTGWTSTGVMIMTGSLFALTMWANVWFIIWPNQKIVIANANAVLGGAAANPAAAAAAPKALLASRTNTLFSIPMLFFMLSARHLGITLTPESNVGGYFAAIFVVWAVVEGNAIKGKLGPITTIKGVITWGFVLTAVVYALLEVLL